MSILIDTSIPSSAYQNFFSVPSGATGLQYVYSNPFTIEPGVFGKLILTGTSGAFIDDLIYGADVNGYFVAFNFPIPNEGFQYESLILNSGSQFTFPNDGGSEYIGYWASGIWQFGLGEPTSISSLSISGWLTSTYVLGKINTLLQVCHSGYSGLVSPRFNIDELGVAEKMYMANYYGLLARGAVAGNNVVSVRDGDASVTLVNSSTISRNFLDAAKQANNELNYLANAYRGNEAFPRDVSFYYLAWNNYGASYWGSQGYVG